MIIANRHLGFKLVALALVVSIFATLLPSHMTFWAEDSFEQVLIPEDDPGSIPVELTDESSADNTIDALFEDTSLRTPTSKTLRQNDGTYKLGSYNFEVHFQTAEGYVEYDNTLIHKWV